MRKILTLLVHCAMLLGIPSLSIAASCGQLTEPMTKEAIFERIKPVGSVESEGGVVAAAVTTELSETAGEDRYKSTCAVCHATGVGGAPKFRNEADWKPRMDVGIDGMLAIAIKGKGSMPPKGTCMQCSDKELRMTIEYMIPQKK
ncbi:MAG: cytochrome c5 family protein [Proteobacteria bacterium]|nr:cytochrome c5 family protein [Pseudomonadota bacterium]